MLCSLDFAVRVRTTTLTPFMLLTARRSMMRGDRSAGNYDADDNDVDGVDDDVYDYDYDDDAVVRSWGRVRWLFAICALPLSARESMQHVMLCGIM